MGVDYNCNITYHWNRYTAASVENTKDIISGIVGSITFPLIGLAINIVILYYLYRRHVRAYFDKAKPQPPTTV
jgi:hypothetical protein